MTTLVPGTTERFLGLAASGLPRPAIDFALELTGGGLPLDRLILDVLGPTQQQVGHLWQSNRWSVAQEHAATAVVDGVLGAIALQASPRRTGRGSVLVACVEGEYHSLAARLGVELLRYDGWEVAFLGASLPASDLQGFTAIAAPDVVVLSCTVPLFLPGGGRCFAALAEIGVPAVAAGAGFGTTGDRAARLGASGWIGQFMSATAVLKGSLTPAGPPKGRDAEAAQLELAAEEVAAAVLAEMFMRMPALSSHNDLQQRTGTDVATIVSYLGLALDLEEPQLFAGFVSWLADVQSSRKFPPALVSDSLDLLAGVMERRGLPRAAQICSSARAQLLPT